MSEINPLDLVGCAFMLGISITWFAFWLAIMESEIDTYFVASSLAMSVRLLFIEIINGQGYQDDWIIIADRVTTKVCRSLIATSNDDRPLYHDDLPMELQCQVT